MRKTLIALVVAGALLSSQTASADVIGSRQDGFTDILGGTFQLGFHNMLLVNFDSQTLDESETTVSQLGANWTFGANISWFVIDNLAITFQPNFFLNHTAQTTTPKDGDETSSKIWEYGVLGFIMVHYYIKAGKFFFAPGVGAGGFWGKRSSPTGEQIDGKDVELKETIFGGAARIDLNLVFYTSDKFNIYSGLSLVMWFGAKEQDEDEDEGSTSELLKSSMFSIDAGFNVGFTFVL